jgi:hypothetical protein
MATKPSLKKKESYGETTCFLDFKTVVFVVWDTPPPKKCEKDIEALRQKQRSCWRCPCFGEGTHMVKERNIGKKGTFIIEMNMEKY